MPPSRVASLAPSTLFLDDLGRRYEAHAELGRGVLTYVQAAARVGEQDPTAYAIKTLLPLWVGHPIAEARIARERELSSALHGTGDAHASCARILGAGRQPLDEVRSRPFHVSPRLEGRTLADALRDKALTARVAHTLAWADELLAALEGLHRLGWVHRDVKPHNVFLEHRPAESGRTERAVLIDFGLAVRIGCGRIEGDEPFGTPAYVAPEVIAGEKLDGRTDLYSVGLLLYEALAGQRPFAGRDPVQLLDAHLCEAPPPLRELAPQISPELDAVISATLAKPPSARPDGAGALRELLRRTPEAAR